jgi:outer membrane receptor for ferrienterochelin and colicin
MVPINKSKQALLALLISISGSNAVADHQYFELSLFELQNTSVEVASLFEDNKLDVASSTASISRKNWQDRGAISLGQALEGVPSVFTNNVWGGSEAISIRGFATKLSVRGVAQSIDGIPLGSYTYASPSYLLPRAPLNLLNQVEMIRGPGSTLYGNDAFHGVIAMKLYAQEKNQGEAIIQAGSPGQYEVTVVNSYHNNNWQIHAGGSLTKDGNHDLDYSFTDAYSPDTIGTGTREQGYENVSGFLKVNNGSLSNTRGKFSFTLFQNEFTSNEFQGVGSAFYLGVPNSFSVESPNLAGDKDSSNNKTKLSIVSLAHEISFNHNLQLKNHIYHWQSEQEWAFDNSEYPDELIFRPDFANPALAGTTALCKVNQTSVTYNRLYCPHTLYQGTEESRTGFYTQLKQAENIFNTQWVLGLGFDNIEITDGRFERINEQGVTSQLDISPYIGKRRELGHILAQARTGVINDRLLITYGARWDYYSDVDNHFSPRLGLIYKTTDSWTQKILFGHAYRAPTALEQYGSGSSIGDINLKSETIETYEFINIYQKLGFEIEAVVFHSSWKNSISFMGVNTSSGPAVQYKNIFENNTKGFELSLRSKLEKTTVNGSLSFTDSSNKTDEVNYVAFPRWLGSINIEQPIKETLKLGLWQRIMLAYQLNDADITSEKESYYRSDLYLNGQVSPRLNVIANIQNAFDEKNILPSYYGSEGGLLDYGRIIKASIKYKL